MTSSVKAEATEQALMIAKGTLFLGLYLACHMHLENSCRLGEATRAYALLLDRILIEGYSYGASAPPMDIGDQ